MRKLSLYAFLLTVMRHEAWKPHRSEEEGKIHKYEFVTKLKFSCTYLLYPPRPTSHNSEKFPFREDLIINKIATHFTSSFFPPTSLNPTPMMIIVAFILLFHPLLRIKIHVFGLKERVCRNANPQTTISVHVKFELLT